MSRAYTIRGTLPGPFAKAHQTIAASKAGALRDEREEHDAPVLDELVVSLAADYYQLSPE